MAAESEVTTGSLIVGVADDQPARVVVEAARFAREADAPLVCALVNTSRYPIEQRKDGSVRSMPLDVEIPDPRDEVFPPDLSAHIRDILSGEYEDVFFRALAGDPAEALGNLAETLQARAIVVGTRHPGFRAGVEEFFTGSVAVRLAHRQPRPVIVIPLTASTTDQPWDAQ